VLLKRIANHHQAFLIPPFFRIFLPKNNKYEASQEQMTFWGFN